MRRLGEVGVAVAALDRRGLDRLGAERARAGAGLSAPAVGSGTGIDELQSAHPPGAVLLEQGELQPVLPGLRLFGGLVGDRRVHRDQHPRRAARCARAGRSRPREPSAPAPTGSPSTARAAPSRSARTGCGSRRSTASLTASTYSSTRRWSTAPQVEHPGRAPPPATARSVVGGCRGRRRTAAPATPTGPRRATQRRPAAAPGAAYARAAAGAQRSSVGPISIHFQASSP